MALKAISVMRKGSGHSFIYIYTSIHDSQVTPRRSGTHKWISGVWGIPAWSPSPPPQSLAPCLRWGIGVSLVRSTQNAAACSLTHTNGVPHASGLLTVALASHSFLGPVQGASSYLKPYMVWDQGIWHTASSYVFLHKHCNHLWAVPSLSPPWSFWATHLGGMANIQLQLGHRCTTSW